MVRLLYFMLFLGSQNLYAQVGIQNLYFNSTENILQLNFEGETASINYTGIGSGSEIGEGIAHLEDEEGNVIIWVNASGVYDRNGILMPGSVGILAHPSSTEIVIAPYPENPSKFYIFYNNQLCSQLYYSVVDMAERGGRGDVTRRNELVDAGNSFAEGLEVIKIPCSDEFWLLAYQCYTGIKAFRLDKSGVSSAKIIAPFDAEGHNGRGELDYHNGKLGYAITYKNKAFISDFDPVTGLVANPKTITFPATNGIYGLEFSPDGSKAYFTDWNNRDFFGNIASPNLFQYDFSSGNIDSWTIPYNTENCQNLTVEGLGQIEQGKDGNLYIPHVNGCQVTVVKNSNTLSPEFELLDVNTTLSAGVSDHIQSFIKPGLVAISSEDSICFDTAVTLSVLGEADNYTWRPSQGLSNPNSPITEAWPEVTTTYTVSSVNKFGCTDSSKITVFVEPAKKPVISMLDNGSCNAEIILHAESKNGEFIWYKDELEILNVRENMLQVDEPGSYTALAIGASCAIISDPIILNVNNFYKANLPFVPNIITPDNDPNHANETFIIRDYHGKVALSIYNRWGREVYKSSDYQNDWAAEGLEVGVYYYRLAHEENCFPEIKGFVHVLK